MNYLPNDVISVTSAEAIVAADGFVGTGTIDIGVLVSATSANGGLQVAGLLDRSEGF